jgi:hypothetical protein
MGTLDTAKAEVDSELRFGQIFKRRESVGVYFSAALKPHLPKSQAIALQVVHRDQLSYHAVHYSRLFRTRNVRN